MGRHMLPLEEHSESEGNENCLGRFHVKLAFFQLLILMIIAIVIVPRPFVLKLTQFWKPENLFCTDSVPKTCKFLLYYPTVLSHAFLGGAFFKICFLTFCVFCSHESLSFFVVTCNKNVGFKTNTGQHSQFYRSHFGDNTQQAGYRSFPLVNNFNTVLPAEKDSNNDHHYHHICNYILMQEQRCCHYVSGQKVISSTSIKK